ncbi:hypothetical protein TRVL_07179 [Trypanosoma vivax]|nr:hypothetical protein TRVL_07179 [Trypanosoma vivax]
MAGRLWPPPPNAHKLPAQSTVPAFFDVHTTATAHGEVRCRIVGGGSRTTVAGVTSGRDVHSVPDRTGLRLKVMLNLYAPAQGLLLVAPSAARLDTHGVR